MEETKKIINDLKKVGIEVFKSPMNYYTIKTKKFKTKKELIREIQMMIINSDYTIMSAKIIGDFIKDNLQSNKEWYAEMKKNGTDTIDYLVKMVGKDKVKEFHDMLGKKIKEKKK